MNRPTDGRYTIVYKGGEYRTIQFKTLTKGGLAGKTILKIKEGADFIGCAFVGEDNTLSFWRNFCQGQPERRLQLIQAAANKVASAPAVAGMAYALRENRCCRCGTELTVPASIHHGMGPDCAKKYGWRKADQVAAFDWAAAEAAHSVAA